MKKFEDMDFEERMEAAEKDPDILLRMIKSAIKNHDKYKHLIPQELIDAAKNEAKQLKEDNENNKL